MRTTNQASTLHGLRQKGSFSEYVIATTRAFQLKLVASRRGRIVLHVLVALKTGHYSLHWHGIMRELVNA